MAWGAPCLRACLDDEKDLYIQPANQSVGACFYAGI